MSNAKRIPEMSQSRSSQTFGGGFTPTIPSTAHLASQQRQHHRLAHGVGSQRSSLEQGTSRHHSHSSEWSKEYEGKGRDSVILGRPISEATVVDTGRPSRQSRPQSLTFEPPYSPYQASDIGSPRSTRNQRSDGNIGGHRSEGERTTPPFSPASRNSRPDSATSILEPGECRCRQTESNAALLEDKALSILVYLSGPNILISFLMLLWALVAILTTAILCPIHCLTKGTDHKISACMTSFLTPPLRIQHAFVYSDKLQATRPCVHNATPTKEYHAGTLVMVHLLSPLLSVGVAIAAWVAAVFWFYASILGDPSGSDKPYGYNDGKSSVLGVRAWWEHWLSRPIKKR